MTSNLKKLSLVMAFLIILVSLSGCASNSIPNEIELSLKENTLTSTGLTIIIKNNSDDYDFVYGESYGIETYTNDQWEELPTLKEHTVFTIAYVVHPNSSKEFEIDWEWIYGDLPEGNYRLVKNFEKETAYADDHTDVITSQNLYYYFTIE